MMPLGQFGGAPGLERDDNFVLQADAFFITKTKQYQMFLYSHTTSITAYQSLLRRTLITSQTRGDVGVGFITRSVHRHEANIIQGRELTRVVTSRIALLSFMTNSVIYRILCQPTSDQELLQFGTNHIYMKSNMNRNDTNYAHVFVLLFDNFMLIRCGPGFSNFLSVRDVSPNRAAYILDCFIFKTPRRCSF